MVQIHIVAFLEIFLTVEYMWSLDVRRQIPRQDTLRSLIYRPLSAVPDSWRVLETRQTKSLRSLAVSTNCLRRPNP